MPRFLALVRFNFDGLPAEYSSTYPFEPGASYIFFGEIPNMRGHCVVADHRTGRIYSGYHVDAFIEIPENEA